MQYKSMFLADHTYVMVEHMVRVVICPSVCCCRP